jgi:hypothetical protein
MDNPLFLILPTLSAPALLRQLQALLLCLHSYSPTSALVDTAYCQLHPRVGTTEHTHLTL